MRTPWVPRLVIEEGDRVYEWKAPLDVEVAEIGRLAGEPSMSRADIVFNTIAGPMDVLKAALFTLKKREEDEEDVDFQTLTVDLENTVAYATDETGREITFHTAVMPCPMHRAAHMDVQPDCERCGVDVGPVMSDDGMNIAWFYEDDGTPVPTRRARSATGRMSTPISSGSGSASPSGTPGL